MTRRAEIKIVYYRCNKYCDNSNCYEYTICETKDHDANKRKEKKSVGVRSKYQIDANIVYIL